MMVLVIVVIEADNGDLKIYDAASLTTAALIYLK